MGSKTTSQVTNSPNPTASAAYDDVVGQAQGVASTPYQAYTGQLVAPLNGAQNRAVGELADSYGTAQPYIDQGNAGLGNVENFLQAGSDAAAQAATYQGLGASAFGQAGNYGSLGASALAGMRPYMAAAQGAFGQAESLATPQAFSADAVSQYMSPYLSSVVNATQANLDESDAEQSEQLVGSAIGSGAYGGDRSGVAQAELARQQDLANGQTIAGLYNTGYQNAESEFNAVQGQRQAGAQLLGTLGQGYNTLAQNQGQMAQEYGSLGTLLNQTGSGYTGLAADSLGQASAYGTLGQLQGTTAQAYGTLGTLAQSNLVSGASAALQGGTLRQQNAQQQDTAAYNQYMAGLSYPYQNVGFLSNIVQGIGSQEGNTQTTQGNALSQIAGLGTSTIGLLGATGAFGSSGYLSGLGSSVGSLFSDARVKEDVAPIGKTFDGQTMYRFRYKGDPSGTVHTGLMAQEVEKRTPGAVGEVGGVKTVDYGEATRGAAAMGLGATPPGLRQARATGGPAGGLGMSPFGGPTMPGAAPMGSLGMRQRFDDGGAAIPSGGLNLAGIPGGGAGGLNTGASLGAGRSVQDQQVQTQRGLGTSPQSLGVVSSAPTGSLGTPAPSGSAGGFGGSLGSSPMQSPSSPAFSPGAASGQDGTGQSSLGTPPSNAGQNAWLALATAGADMAASGSMSFGQALGQGIAGGLSTYNTLQQRDQDNAYRQQTLKIDQQRADQIAEQMRQTAEIQRQQLAIQSGTLANQTLNTNSEVATRDQQNQIGRYSRTFVPGQGWLVTDLTDPTKPPQLVPMTGQGSPGAPAGSASPPTPRFTPQPSAGAPPPQGGVPASGMPVGTPGAPSAASGQAAPPATAAPPGGVGTRPQAGSALSAVQVPQAWQPTTTVPQGYGWGVAP